MKRFLAAFALALPCLASQPAPPQPGVLGPFTAEQVAAYRAANPDAKFTVRAVDVDLGRDIVDETGRGLGVTADSSGDGIKNEYDFSAPNSETSRSRGSGGGGKGTAQASAFLPDTNKGIALVIAGLGLAVVGGWWNFNKKPPDVRGLLACVGGGAALIYAGFEPDALPIVGLGCVGFLGWHMFQSQRERDAKKVESEQNNEALRAILDAASRVSVAAQTELANALRSAADHEDLPVIRRVIAKDGLSVNV